MAFGLGMGKSFAEKGGFGNDSDYKIFKLKAVIKK